MMSALLLALILNITLIIVQSQCPFDLMSVNSMVCWIMQCMIEWMILGGMLQLLIMVDTQ